MRAISSILLMAGVALLNGCAPAPLTLKIAVNDIYCTDTACSCVHEIAARGYAETLEQLKKKNGIELQLTYFVEPYQLEEAILSGQYDGIISKPWLALRLQQKAGADYQRVADILDPNNNQWLTGIVIVSADSPIQTLQELTGKHIYLGQNDAYEKHQAARRLFQTKGIQPGKIDMKASCSENIGVLMDEVADAAVISDYALLADCAVDFAKPEDFRILGTTERIPLTSLLLDMNKVDAAAAERVQQALLALSGAQTPETLLGKGFVEPAPWNPPELEKNHELP
jgi:ABC-type phosphate/phosphonate transport system substrate-binding protein